MEAQVLGNYEEGFKTRRAADELADLIMIRAGAETAVSAGGGYLMDITNEPVLNKVADASLEATRFQGKQWMVPTVIYCAAPFYNEDIFADHAMTLPTYWEELLAVCDKFKAAGIIPVTWELATTVNTTFASWEFFGAVIGKDTIPEAQRIYKGQGSFAEWPAFLKAVDRMMLFAKRDYLPPDAQGMNFEAALQYFALGNSAMMTTGAWHTSTLRDSNPDANLNVFPWPANDKGTKTIIDASTEGFAIDHDTEHKSEALTVLDWLTEPKNSGAWALMMGVQSSPTKGVTFPDIPETKTLRTLSPYAEQMFPVRMDQCEGVPPALGRDTTSKIFEDMIFVLLFKCV
jgi:raffinose/stachyose/melibiose transport system substrate-binding protein